MSQAEDKQRGNLDVTLNYIKVGQDIRMAMFYLNRVKDQLDIAAIEKGSAERERRRGERRRNA